MPVNQQTCDDKLTGEFLKKCGYKPKQGLVRKWFGNWDDVDREATVLANRGTKITTLVLKAGAKLFRAEGVSKTLKVKHALVVGDFSNGYTHTDNLAVAYRGEEERERLQEIVEGARLFSINEKVDGGEAGELTFEIFGFESGMLVMEENYDSAANSGVASLMLATQAGEEESTGGKLFLLAGGVAATADWIEANSF